MIFGCRIYQDSIETIWETNDVEGNKISNWSTAGKLFAFVNRWIVAMLVSDISFKIPGILVS